MKRVKSNAIIGAGARREIVREYMSEIMREASTRGSRNLWQREREEESGAQCGIIAYAR